MKELETKVRFEDDNGNTFEMILLKEFTYNKKKYAVLMEADSCETCNEGCHCEDKNMGILEVTKDKDGKDVFITIEDDKLFEEAVAKAEEALLED
jgi:hypothetical protein